MALHNVVALIEVRRVTVTLRKSSRGSVGLSMISAYEISSSVAFGKRSMARVVRQALTARKVKSRRDENGMHVKRTIFKRPARSQTVTEHNAGFSYMWEHYAERQQQHLRLKRSRWGQRATLTKADLDEVRSDLINEFSRKPANEKHACPQCAARCIEQFFICRAQCVMHDIRTMCYA